jgi:hypothetical protein
MLDRGTPSPYNSAALQGAGCRPWLAQVAQLVEHVTENHGVGGSIPPLGTMPIFDPLIIILFSRFLSASGASLIAVFPLFVAYSASRI